MRAPSQAGQGLAARGSGPLPLQCRTCHEARSVLEHQGVALLAVFLPIHVLQVLLDVMTENLANWAVDLDIWAQAALLEKTLELRQLNDGNVLRDRAALAAKPQPPWPAKPQPLWQAPHWPRPCKEGELEKAGPGPKPCLPLTSRAETVGSANTGGAHGGLKSAARAGNQQQELEISCTEASQEISPQSATSA